MPFLAHNSSMAGQFRDDFICVERAGPALSDDTKNIALAMAL